MSIINKFRLLIVIYLVLVANDTEASFHEEKLYDDRELNYYTESNYKNLCIWLEEHHHFIEKKEFDLKVKTDLPQQDLQEEDNQEVDLWADLDYMVAKRGDL